MREYEQIGEAYRQIPDSVVDADDWSNAEEWRLFSPATHR
jgi:hypothetical protein